MVSSVSKVPNSAMPRLGRTPRPSDSRAFKHQVHFEVLLAPLCWISQTFLRYFQRIIFISRHMLWEFIAPKMFWHWPDAGLLSPSYNKSEPRCPFVKHTGSKSKPWFGGIHGIPMAPCFALSHLSHGRSLFDIRVLGEGDRLPGDVTYSLN